MSLLTSKITWKLENGTVITVYHDDTERMELLRKFILSQDNLVELSNDIFVFSDKKSFDECTSKAIRLGLIPGT